MKENQTGMAGYAYPCAALGDTSVPARKSGFSCYSGVAVLSMHVSLILGTRGVQNSTHAGYINQSDAHDDKMIRYK
jgi:hypothetical protein